MRPFGSASVSLRNGGFSSTDWNLEFKREWDGRYYGVQQVAPVVAEEEDRIVVITVYTFYIQEGAKR